MVPHEETTVLRRIQAIEREVSDLKLSILRTFSPSSRRIISLKGILTDVEVTETDFETAKKSLYGRIKL